MKILCSILVLFLFPLCAAAQDVSDPSAASNVTVIEKKWRLEVWNLAVEKDPLKEISDREKETRERREAERMNDKLRQQGMVGNERPPVPRVDHTPRGIRTQYIYEAKIRNTGRKTIRAVSWDYVFFEPATDRELGRRRFVSKVHIRAGKTMNVVMYSAISPTGTVDATTADKDPKDQYHEQIVIRSVEYTDGTVWQAASN